MMLGELTTFEHMGRQIIVYLPKAYHLFTERSFPAVFLQDGDFLFKESIADIERDVEAGITEPVIFIGIDSQRRNDEYTPWEMPALLRIGPLGARVMNIWITYIRNWSRI